MGHKLANARGDTVAIKPTFRSAFRHRRGLIPADLFYEWQVVPGQKTKQPWCIRLPDDAPFLFGAVWEEWQPKDDPIAQPLATCAIITTAANSAMSSVHDRMPQMIAAVDADQWLHPDTPTTSAQALIQPWAGPLELHPVSTWLNTPRHDDATCAERITIYTHDELHFND